MSRHLYVLIVDCPERDNGIAHDITALADKYLCESPGTRSVMTEVIVPPTGLQSALRPRVVLEEVQRDAAWRAEVADYLQRERDASER